MGISTGQKFKLFFKLIVTAPGAIIKGVISSLINAFLGASALKKLIIIGVVAFLYKTLKSRHKSASLLGMNRSSMDESAVAAVASSYEQMFDSQDATSRLESYTTVVNSYYDLATDFYEWGWGQSFHFGTRFVGETLTASVARHEHYLSSHLGLKPGMDVLDVGCGVGGPMISIARFSGANLTGLNNNAYQISRGQKLVAEAGLAGRCGFVKADFMHIPVEDASYDAVYEIEATCHAPDRVACYSEINRILKDGGLFGGYEWTMTDKYDPNNPAHNKIKHDIAIGNGLPDIITSEDVRQALIDSGYEIVEFVDLAPTTPENPIPWYYDMQGSYSLSRFRLTKVGKWCSHALVNVLETLGLSPKGSVKTHEILIRASEGLLAGGEQELFTPMLFFIARKVSDAPAAAGTSS
ncbi:cycloartenol-C-24-methyltransferase [Thecamonas trahens ATCC 50062]|uniref:Methyltransferase n=1 Tax=Thecamonas trahens ATCC 50062 TaxID=461836 RepID=A0A0L0DWH5_THETB|nr:cycloartenol-C-24-methyltransferase [Thecamonas trahens ATCC 50062]KNC55873.1 cycloartenol-C-24-methyltransferase [Thecamonas trahens ATCC 50062]|eukprot:XP_013752795.1 cycloartenol-C-24-methyltransferase [Thecamonas trahens ATCC 50062]